MVGNLEQLSSIRDEYRRDVSKAYKKWQNSSNDSRFSSRWPLYRPIEFYSRAMKNDALAKAHSKVRRELLTKHHVTFLPEAEQSRMTVMIILEDNETGFTPRKINKSMQYKKTIHRESILNELEGIFKDHQMPDKLFSEVNTFLEYEYFAIERNNIIIDKTLDYNIHLRENVVRLMSYLIFMNKLYWDKPEEDWELLTEDDKTIIRFYMRYNYNTLDKREAAMSEKPFINDLYVASDDVLDEEFLLEDIKRKEEKAKEPLKLDFSKENSYLEEIKNENTKGY